MIHDGACACPAAGPSPKASPNRLKTPAQRVEVNLLVTVFLPGIFADATSRVAAIQARLVKHNAASGR
jgi:hypothetical protein